MCDFADGEESADGGFAVEVCDDAPALVVGGGDDGDGFFEGVVSEFEESFVDEGESVGEFFAEWGDVEEGAWGAGAFDFGIDGAGNDVSRCEGASRVVIVDEGVAFFIDKDGAFASDGFGDEKGAGFGASGGGVVEAGGVELNEFHVGDGGSCAPGHGEAVAGGGVGVGGVEVGFAASSGGEDDAGCLDGHDFVGLGVEGVDAEDAVVGDGS